MAPGEIYFIGFYPNSFASDVGNNYYLFGNNTNGGDPIYYHMFVSRSFNIIEAPTGKVYGSTLVIEGVNLLSISDVLAKQSGVGITNGTWTTKSIHIDIKISASTCLSSIMPFASVYMKNVNNTHIEIQNLDLKG